MAETTSAVPVDAQAGSGTPGPPPPTGHWTTRADLLRDRAEALRVLHRADLSVRTVGTTALVVVAAAVVLVMTGAGFREDSDGESTSVDGTVSAVLSSVIAAIGLTLGYWALRRTLRARDVGLARRAWEDLADDASARALPRGQLDPALREPFDARTDPDGEEFIGRVLSRAYVAPLESRLLVRSVPAGLGLVFGFACVGAPLSGEWEPTLVGFLPAGALLLGSGGVQAVKSTQRGWRATQRWKHAKREHDQWRAQRSTGS